MTNGSNQWIQPTVRNRLSETIVLANFDIKYGKFYDINDPFNEVVSPQGTTILSKGEFTFGHCGRAGSPTGTEGTFEIHSATGDKLGAIYWDCPYIGSNSIKTIYQKEGYIVNIEGFSDSGALGKGTITILAD